MYPKALEKGVSRFVSGLNSLYKLPPRLTWQFQVQLSRGKMSDSHQHILRMFWVGPQGRPTILARIR